jgi:hypothetical protein
LRREFRREKQQRIEDFFGDGQEFAKIRSKRLLTALDMQHDQAK